MSNALLELVKQAEEAFTTTKKELADLTASKALKQQEITAAEKIITQRQEELTKLEAEEATAKAEYEDALAVISAMKQ